MAIKPKLQSLLASANEVTGEERTNLTDAMQDLVDGYGQDTSISMRVEKSTTNPIMSIDGIDFRRDVHGYIYPVVSANNLNIPRASKKNEIRFCVKFLNNATNNANALICNDASGSWTKSIYIFFNATADGITYITVGIPYASYSVNWFTLGNLSLSNNEWYYVVFYFDKLNSIGCLSVFDNSKVVIRAKTFTVSQNYYDADCAAVLYGGKECDQMTNGLADVRGCFIEADNSFLWGNAELQRTNIGKYNFQNPSEFTKVDWLGSTGTQRIETGIKMDSAKVLRIKGDFYFTDVITRQLIGSQGGFYIGVVNGKYQLGTAGTTSSNVDVSANAWHNFDATFDGNHPSTADNATAIFDDSVNHSENIPFSTSNDYMVSLFSLNGQNLPCNCKIGRRDFEIYVNSVLQRRLTPCYHTETGILGMFDSVNNKFYWNAGTGDFTKPSDTSGEINLAEYLASLT